MATQWLVAGVPVKVVSEWLSHANVAITRAIHGHLLHSMQAAAAERMDARFFEGDRPQKHLTTPQ
ncbi:MAG: hypothetical protein OWU84_08835 [Firmicutes bacterium]|nr:hypothetical protein [Bacillota bacterium]